MQKAQELAGLAIGIRVLRRVGAEHQSSGLVTRRQDLRVEIGVYELRRPAE